LTGVLYGSFEAIEKDGKNMGINLWLFLRWGKIYNNLRSAGWE